MRAPEPKKKTDGLGKKNHNFFNRLMVPMMILRLGFVDPVDHIASSISARHVARPELSELSGRAHPVFSYVPLSQIKLQAVCCRERLHVTVFGKLASLSLERASNCTKIPYFESVSKYSCMVRYQVSSDRVEFHPTPYASSIGFTVVKNYRLSSSLEAFSWS